MRLKDKVALVTGSSRGIGRGIALAFAREGADVVVNCVIRVDKATEVLQEIESMGRRAIVFRADVSKRSEVDEMVNSALQTFGRIDILVNNAGIVRRLDMLETTEEDWDRVMNVNVKGVFNCTQVVARHMVERRSGKIINTSSVVGFGTAMLRHFVYPVSKAAVFNLTRRAAFELGKYGINVNSIAPGMTITDIMYEDRTEEEVASYIEEKTKASALGKACTPQDIANAAVFLASDESNLITGQIIVVDGGRTDNLSHSA